MPTATLNISKKKFTQAYWKIAAIKSRYRVVRGGSSAGKSFAIAQDEILNALRVKGKTLIIRKVANTIQDSVFASFESRLTEFGLAGRYKKKTSPFDIRLPNGSLLLFRGLDDPEKIKSIDGVSRIFIEEATELDEVDLKELDRRLRAGDSPQMTLAFNPIDESHWLKSYFFDKQRAKCETLVLTYKDNEFASQEEKELIESYKADDDDYSYSVYALGDWGQIKNGSEFYPKWSLKFVEETPFMPELQHAVTGWDFNVTPYMTCMCCQIRYITRYYDEITKERSKEPFIGAKAITVLQFRFYYEYAFDKERNSVESIAEQYRADHESWLGIYDMTMDVYGDAQGFNRVEGLGSEKRFDWIIDSESLTPYIHNSSLKAKNPNVAPIKRRDFINQVFSGKHPDVEIVIDPSCVELIDDFKHCKQGTKEGKLFKIKKRVKNKATGETYEEHGHASDAAENIICEVCRDMIKKS